MKKAFLACGFAAALAACGGGGSGGGPVVNVPVVSTLNFPISATFTAFFSKLAAYQASAKDANGNTYSLTYQISPGADKTLTGSAAPAPLKTVLATATVSVNGGAPVSSSSEIYFAPAPFKIWGINGANFEQQPHALAAAPVTAAVGLWGQLAAGYLTTPAGFFYDAWSRNIFWILEADTATTAWLCLDISIDTTPPGREKDCVRINDAGVVSGFKSMVVTNGTVLYFQ